MTTTKQRLDNKIKSQYNKVGPHRGGISKMSCYDTEHEVALKQIKAANLLAPLLLEMVDAIQRRMKSDDACNNPFDENLGEAINKFKEFLK
jgi:hypothetical protein